MKRLTGWRYGLFIGTFLTAVAVNGYFVILSPLMNPEPYKLIREQVKPRLPNQGN
ncbi:uncharacterized protein LOC143265347 [Megachile rotundata]|uniref:uncharacterized protein LOC143265347 n=1 Tax=Megachile rotundata TaxID=143995 RepID=UPI003FD1D7E8